MSEQEEVPPLEDIPKVLSQIQKENSAISKCHLKKESKKEFGWMEKGFLTKKEKDETTSLPFVRASKVNPSFVFPEVQKKMEGKKRYSEFQEKLHSRLSSNPKYSDVLDDPRWLPILQDFSLDPKGAIKKYMNDSEIMETMAELCSVFGTTLESFGCTIRT